MMLTTQDKDLLNRAKAVLDQNWTGSFTKPAPSLYPHQWNWDSGFIALAYAHYAPERAFSELRHLFGAQWENGMLPQIVFRPESETDGRYFPGADFWQADRSPYAPKHIRTSGITMPPVHGFVLWRIYETLDDKTMGREILAELFPKILALHEYLYTQRDPKGEGLIYIRHPWEPGTDNSPLWDEALQRIPVDQFELPAYERVDLQNKKAAAHRPTDDDYDRYVFLVDLFRRNDYNDEAIYQQCPFLIQDPLFNAILAWSNECLMKMGSILEKDTAKIERWHQRTVNSMNSKLWSEERGCYDAWDLYVDERIPGMTSSCLMPLIAGVPGKEQVGRMVKELIGPAFSDLKNGQYRLCPTTSPQHPIFNPEKYWRGPLWVNMNWLLYHGLQRHGFSEIAQQIKKDTLALLLEFGFYEYFNPLKSAHEPGCGTSAFSWSAALCIDFLLEKDRKTPIQL